MTHTKDLELTNGNGSKVKMPIVMLISIIAGCFLYGASTLAWATGTFVTKEVYEQDYKDMATILKEIRDDMKITKTVTTNIKATLISKGIKVIEVN